MEVYCVFLVNDYEYVERSGKRNAERMGGK